MRVALDTPPRKATFVLSALLLMLPYLFWVQRHYRASLWGQSLHTEGLQRAIDLERSNSDFYDSLGRLQLFVDQNPQASVKSFHSAAALNRSSSRYWLDLATAERLLGNYDEQQHALEEAIKADPKTPAVAWEAGNFFLADGQTNRALDDFKVVLENDAESVRAVLQLSWRATHDVDLILQHAMPPQLDPHFQFLELLTQARETQASMTVWHAIERLNQPFRVQLALPFAHYLIEQHEIDRAQEVWARLAQLSPSLRPAKSSADGNLITNGDFEEDIVSGGFSWIVNVLAPATPQVDDSEFHTGSSSLSLTFKSDAFGDSGFYQLVPVKPSSRYELLADFKSQEIESANGPRLMVVDGYTNVPLAIGTEWQGTHVWREDALSFRTGPDVRLVRVMIGRSPADGLIRGRLWIDNVRMFERQ